MRWALALFAPLGACALQLALWRFIPPSPHLFFHPAVFLVAYFAGSAEALLTVALSTALIAYRFLEPFGRVHVASARDALDLFLFCAVSSLVIFLTDRARRSLERAERAQRAKNEILSIVSHDLRSPITAIGLSAESILRNPDAQRVTTDAERIRRLARAAAKLVDDVVTLEQGEAGVIALELDDHPADALVRHARDAALPLAEAKCIALHADVELHERVTCDAARVRQVLANLVGNALRFTRKGGEIRISVRRDGDDARFAVTDTGAGIDEDALPHVFDRRFTTDRASHAGLGLHIARTLILAHGGDIGVVSRKGEGTTFWFSLPLSIAAHAEPGERRTADFRA